MTIKKIILYIVLLFSLESCLFGDNPNIYEKELPENLSLSAMFEMRELTVWKNNGDGFFTGIINPTIFEIGWTNQYIIAKTHPDLSKKISRSDTMYYKSELLKEQSDSLSYAEGRLYKKNEKWWLISMEMKPGNDSLYPYRAITNYSIVDILNNNKHYEMETEKDFQLKRKELGVPDTLSFFLKFDKLK